MLSSRPFSSPRREEEELPVGAPSTSTANLLPRLVADDVQLKDALKAFQYAHSARLSSHWAIRYYLYFVDAGIDSMNALLAGCKEDTINLDLDFIGVSPNDRIDSATIQYLINFLPGPVGIRCFRLAQMAAEKVRRGEADVKYVHRPENGNAGNELWHVIPHSRHSTPLHSRQNSFVVGSGSPSHLNALNELLSNDGLDEPPAPQWTLHVDCAGFVRSVLKHITKDVVQVSLSDRSFMRAKDFYRFFETLERTVTDKEPLPIEVQHERIKKWRLINDLRMVIPGDIIVYRPKGNAAGGAAFTTNDRSDLKHLLKAVIMALLYKNEMDLYGPKHLVTRNLGRDPSVKPFVQANRDKLNAVGIQSCTQLRERLTQLNDLLLRKELEPFDDFTIQLMKECSETCAKNTGHIVFASGSPVLMDNGEYRIKVVHSTKHGVNQTQGVQQYYRRFLLREGPDGPKWTRVAPGKPIKSKSHSTAPLSDKNLSEHTVGAIPETRSTNEDTPTNDDLLVGQTSAGESSNEKEEINIVGKGNSVLLSTTVTTGEDEGDDNIDDEDIDGDDPDDPDTNIKSEHDVPESDVDDENCHPGATGSGLFIDEEEMVDVVTDDENELGASNRSCKSHRSVKICAPWNENVGVGGNDELAGLADVEVLAARMCF